MMIKAAESLSKGDVIVPAGEMPLQVDAVSVGVTSVAVFYFDGRDDTSLNVPVGTKLDVLDAGETWCYDHGVVTFIDKGEEVETNTGWCALSCGCLYEDDLEEIE